MSSRATVADKKKGVKAQGRNTKNTEARTEEGRVCFTGPKGGMSSTGWGKI